MVLPQWICHTCETAVIGGTVRYSPDPVDDPADGSVLICCSQPGDDLTNIVKHAQATRAWIRLEIAADRCVVVVRDDGIGGAHPRPETSGLIGLSDRIGAIGGTLDVTSPRTGGTMLRASVPLPEVSGVASATGR